MKKPTCFMVSTRCEGGIDLDIHFDKIIPSSSGHFLNFYINDNRIFSISNARYKLKYDFKGESENSYCVYFDIVKVR